MPCSIKILLATELTDNVYVVSMVVPGNGQTTGRAKRKARARSTMVADSG